MNTVEDAYGKIAHVLSSHASTRWEKLIAFCPILGAGCGGVETTQVNGTNTSDIPIGMDVFKLQEACLFLRADILKKTGQRIWGLKFTPWPNGKFNIEYDYNKPSGYEESDETMTLEEALKSIGSQKSI